nr:hypothetical protein [uncultured Cohaesibacter sp.]
MRLVAKYVLSPLLLILISSNAFAEGPGSGSITKHNINIGGCNASELTVKWNLDSLMGEPTSNATYKWVGEADCEPAPSTVIWLKLQSGDTYGFVDISPVSVKAGKGWAFSVAGSPNWDHAVCGYHNTQTTKCFDSASAKKLWKIGRVTDFSLTWNSSSTNSKKTPKTTTQQSETKNNKKQTQASNASPQGSWIVYVGKSQTKLTLNSNGNASYYSFKDQESYPARWSGSNNQVKMRVYGTRQHYNKDDPALILNLTIQGKHISGTQSSPNPKFKSFHVEGEKT